MIYQPYQEELLWFATLNITRDELQEMERYDKGSIRWKKWDEAVKRTKKDIKDTLNSYNVPKKPKKRSWKVLQITQNGEEITHMSADEASKTTGLSICCIRNAAAGKYYQTHNYAYSRWYYIK
jgi:hypothetical protein